VLATYEAGEDLRAKQSETLLNEVRERLDASEEELSDNLRDLDDRSNRTLTSLLLVRDRTVSALQRHTTETAQSDADYQAAVLKIQETHSLLLKRADDDFQSAVDQATADREAALTAAGDRHENALAAAAARFDSAMDAADAAFDTAVDSAVGQLSATVEAELTAFDTAVSTAQATRDALTAPLSSAFDPHAPESNADYLTAVTAAQARLENRVTDIIAHFEQAMQSHLDQHAASLAAADAAFQDSLETADEAYAAQMQAAYQVHQDSVTEAIDTFDESVQQVQDRFEAATTQAFETYDREWKEADDTYTAAITRADTTYESKTASLQTAYDEYKAAAPAEYTAQVKAAADAWVADIISARDSARPLVPTAAKHHWQTVVDSLGTLAVVSDTKVQDAIQAFVAQLNTAAKAASSQYADDMNRSIGTFASYDEFLIASNRRLREAVLGYLDSVVHAANDNFESLRTKSLSALDQLFDTVTGEIREVAEADSQLLVAQAETRAALDQALQAGEAVFHQKLADLQSAALQKYQTETATYQKGRNAAVAKRETAKAQAVADRTLARTTAGETLVKSITTAAETAVSEYTADWKTLRESLGSARDTLVDSAADAEENWNKALNEADEAWVTAAREAAREYTVAGKQSRSTASSELRQATQNFSTEVYGLWIAAMQSIYPASQDRDTFVDAWQTYGATVTAAWTAASARLTDSVNQFSDTIDVAEESRLRAAAVATHEHNLAITEAEIDRLVAEADAQREFDTRFTTQAITRAKAKVAADARHDREQAAAAREDIDTQAKSARALIEQAATDEQEAEDQRASAREELANRFYEQAFGEAKGILEESEQAVRQWVEQMVEEARQAGDMNRDALLAGLQFLRGQRRNDLDKGLTEGLAAVQKRLKSLHDGPLADLTIYQTDAGHGTVPSWVLGLLDNLQGLKTQFSLVSDQDRQLKGLQVAVFPEKPSQPQALSAAGPDAYTVLNRVMGLTGRIAYRDQVGDDFVGWYDVALGMVIRSTRRTADGPIREIAKPYAEVRETDLNSPKWTEADWNVFFGGLSTNDPGDPETETLSYRAIEFLVGQEKLAQNDGLLGDILLTTQLVTEAVGLVDPFGVADGVNAVVCLAQGDNVGAAMAVASIAVPFGADKLIKHAQKVPTGLVAKAKNHVVDFAESAAYSFRKTADRADDVVAQARHAKKVGEETATSMAARCGNPGNCFVAGTWVLVAHAPPELPRLADTVGATTSGGEWTSTSDTVLLAPLLAAGAMGLWLTDRPARRRPRRFVRNQKSIRQRLPGREAFLEPGDDQIAPRSPGQRNRRVLRNVSASRRMETALATVAALPGAAVPCERFVTARNVVSRGWNLIWNIRELSRVSASVAVSAWPQSPAMRDTARGARQPGIGAGLRRGVAVVLAVAALACWLGKSGASPIAPSTAAQPTASSVAVGAALIEQSPNAQPVRSEAVTGPSGAAYYARAIETIQTGQRVLARNPELAGGELPDAAVDPATWVNIRLRMPKPTGDFLEITLLRPVEWLAEHLAQTTALDGEYPRALAEARGTDCTSGITTVCSVMPTVDPPELSPEMVEPITADSFTASPWIFLTLPELEAVGPAEIVEVGRCPELEPGEGRLVTGTFAHQSGEVFDIAVDGLAEPIGCTGAHPFWCEDRHAFIPARDLRLGETLRTESGTLRQITRITPRRGPPVAVFNLEVDAEHVYYVSVDGVLVHNACGDFRGPVESRHFSSSVQGRELHEIAQSYREAAQLGPYRNVATADVTVDGVRKSVRFKNDPSGMHSEQRLIAWHKLMSDRGSNIELHGIYTERPPCGPGSADCRDTLGNYFGQFLDVWHGNR